jgi:uncharacterized protein (TIGR03437 family)
VGRISILFFAALLLLAPGNGFAQLGSPSCNITAVAPVIHAEGLAERLGDLVITCVGTPNAEVTGNLAVILNTTVANRVSSTGVPDIVLTEDRGTGAALVNVSPQVIGNNQVAFNGLRFGFGADGRVALRLSNVRADATYGRASVPSGFGVGVGTAVIAQVAFNPPGLLNFTRTTFNVGVPQAGLMATSLSTVVPNQLGSPLPEEVTFANLIAAKTFFSAVRVSEGFASSFEPRQPMADTGVRIVLRLSGFPSDARLFAPILIAGSNAAQPTVAGLFAGTVSGGRYSQASQTLLLGRVFGADPNGAGGFATTGSATLNGTAELNEMTEITISGGMATLVYEVLDSDSTSVESAQIPVFIGLPRSGVERNVQTSVSVSLGPVSTAVSGASGAIPRFIGAPPTSDCGARRDCSAVLPKLEAPPVATDFTLIQGAGVAERFIPFNNSGAEPMPWSARVEYRSGSNWIQLTPTAGSTSGTVRMFVTAGSLAPGTYEATVIIDAGIAGVARYPVTLRVNALPPPPQPRPTISSLVNGASFSAGPLVAGSFATLRGSNFGSANLRVTFDGKPATILFSNSEQINVRVPADLTAGTAQVVVITGDVQSAPMSVTLARVSPGIFNPGILNEDNSVNSPQNPAKAGSFVQIYATGLLPASGEAEVDGKVHDAIYPGRLPYAGPAPGVEGLQQVNLQLLEHWPTMTTEVVLCSTAAGQRVCSPPAKIHIMRQ